MRKGFVLAAAVAASFAASAASATILTQFEGIPSGVANFNATVTAAGATPKATQLTGLSNAVSVDVGDFVITKTSGATVVFDTYGGLSGQSVNINPQNVPLVGPIGSGMTLTFDDPINSIGFEVGDWATCCFLPTELFISFDDGTPIKVASATNSSQGLFPDVNGDINFTIFVAAFDDTGDFTKVQFWGNGFGEFLTAGGTVRYALVDEGTLPPAIPLPAAGWMLLSGVAALGAVRARKAVKA